MTYVIESRNLTAQDTAVVRGRVPVEQIGSWLAQAYQEIAAYLDRIGVAPAGPPFARFTFDDRGFDVEAGFPLATAVPADARVVPSELPGGTAAVTSYHGPYEEIAVAYEAIDAWLAEHGYTADGPHWEVYFTDPQAEPDPPKWRTDVVAPFEREARGPDGGQRRGAEAAEDVR